MSGDSKIKEFPEISTKLTAPTKKSQFERQKAEAEAKRAREKAETAAVYEDFVKSFDDDGDNKPSGREDSSGRLGGGNYGSFGPGGFGVPSKRHFTGASGPGRLNSGPGSLGFPPPPFSKKRTFDGEPASRRDNSQGLFAYENSGPGSMDVETAFQHSDDEDEKGGDSKADKAAARPTLHLSSLPPGTSPAVIKSVIPSILTVENVKILPTSSSATTERRSSSAIVTLAKDTAATDIDTAVNSVQNRYLGWGFYLSISRHLSSAAISAGVPVATGINSISSQPFGAKSISQMGNSLSRAPPPMSHRGGFAPPSSYTANFYGRPPVAQVNVNPPSDLKQLKLIHKTIEALLTYGPEFEALLMSRTDVQKEERWSWIWNPRSRGGVWYRWRLWDILTNTAKHPAPGLNRDKTTARLFQGSAPWVVPEAPLKFEYTTQLDEFVSNPDYDSEEDDSDNEGERQRRQNQPIAGLPDLDPTTDAEELAFLNPLQKARLTHLLARLPATNARLRRGDVARVTAFAIEHAGEGADEVVEMIVANVSHPFSYSTANPDRQNHENEATKRSKPDEDDSGTPTRKPVRDAEFSEDTVKPKVILDTSPAKLIALYVISDILSSSSTSGVRHAWRYRSLFEAALKSHQTFESLGRLEKDLHWGRLKAEKWKRSVTSVLSVWEGWCVFPQGSQDHFVDVFNHPPLTVNEKLEEENEQKRRKAEEAKMSNTKSKWRAVDENEGTGGVTLSSMQSRSALEGNSDLDGEEMEDLDGEPMDDEDLDGEPMAEDEDEEFDGEPMEENGDEETAEDLNAVQKRPHEGQETPGSGPGQGLGRRRPRPKAEDMFADSDDD